MAKYARVDTLRSDGSNARIDTGFDGGTHVDREGNVTTNINRVGKGNELYQNLNIKRVYFTK